MATLINPHPNKMETAKNIYELELHETLHAPMKWDLRTDIMRVPGGWIYQPIIRDKLGRDTYHPATFVPFNNEFQYSNTPPTS